jgi:hypothetical protein
MATSQRAEQRMAQPRRRRASLVGGGLPCPWLAELGHVDAEKKSFLTSLCARSAERAGCAEGRRPGARGPAERSAEGRVRAERALSQ